MTNQTNSSLVAASELSDSAMYLVNQSTSGHFAVSIDNALYDIDTEQTTTDGLPVCPQGTVRVATEDARCGKRCGVLSPNKIRLA